MSSKSSSKSRSWIASRHLKDSPQGARALGDLAKLDDEVRLRLLETADLLAHHSVNLAHVFFSAAVPTAVDRLDRYEVWLQAGMTLFGPGGAGRDAAQSYFRLDPSGLGEIEPKTREAWLLGATDLQSSARRLATSFVEKTGAALLLAPKTEPARIHAWHEGVRATLAASGWRGEFLGAALIDSAQRLMPLLSGEGVASWTRVLTAYGASGRTAKAPVVPKRFDQLGEDARTRILAVAAEAAETDPKSALRLLDCFAGAALGLPAAAAEHLLQSLEETRPVAALVDALALVPAVTHAMDRDGLLAAMAAAPRVARAVPKALPAYLRSIARAFEEGGADGLEPWLERGFEIGGANPDAGVAHFRLETRTAHKMLTKHSSAVAFEEVEGMLRRYIVMMARRSTQLLSGQGIWYRPPVGPPEDPALRLPERVDIFPTSEENEIFYKLSVAQVAGRWEYGTNDFELSELMRRGWSPPLADEAERDDLVGLLEAFPNPLLAAVLFTLIDGVRVDTRLEADFPGLAVELDRLGRFYSLNRPVAARDSHSEHLLEALFVMSVGRVRAEQLEPRLRAQGEILAGSLELLRKPGATVYDSASLLCLFYGSLAMAHVTLGEEEGEMPMGDYGGATLVDPFDHLDGDDAPFISADDDGKMAPKPDPGEMIDESYELELSRPDGPDPSGGIPLSAEEVRELLERGADLDLTEARGTLDEGLGLYITDLMGKLPADQIEELRQRIAEGDTGSVRAWLADQARGDHYFYDEWDYVIGDFRRRWCRLFEVDVEGDAGKYYGDVMSRSADLIGRFRREFQMMRPEQFRKVHRMQDGEDFDLNAVVEAHADRRTRRTPSDRLYVSRKREERDVATLFLVDMSASTDEPLAEAGAGTTGTSATGSPAGATSVGVSPATSELSPAAALLPPGDAAGPQNPSVPETRRVIDLAKDTLAVIASVLDEIGDAYAIYGFSGHGRDNVEYYHVKSFNEPLNDMVKSRLGGIEPKRSTRMGAALRHSGAKLARVTAKARHLILLSDGFPQDFDYGEDRRSNVYGIRDTTQALAELEREGIQTFCLTVDPAGHDYLGDMCPSSRYAVIDDITELPEELPKIYRQVTRS